MGCSKSSSQKIVYSNINLSREIRKSVKQENLRKTKQPIHTPKREKEQIKPK